MTEEIARSNISEDTEELSQSRKLRQKKRIISSAVAAAVSLSLVMGGLFNSPSDLLKNPPVSSMPPPAIDMYIPDPGDDGDPGDDDDAYSDEKRRGGIKDSLRNLILRMPRAVRACCVLPFWALGWLLITVLTALWGAVLSPVFSTVLGWICTAALLLAGVCLAIKCVFPDMPVKEIIKKVCNRKTISLTVLGVALVAGLDALLPDIWPAYIRMRDIFRFIGCTALLGCISLPFIRKFVMPEKA